MIDIPSNIIFDYFYYKKDKQYKIDFKNRLKLTLKISLDCGFDIYNKNIIVSPVSIVTASDLNKLGYEFGSTSPVIEVYNIPITYIKEKLIDLNYKNFYIQISPYYFGNGKLNMEKIETVKLLAFDYDENKLLKKIKFA